MCPLNCEWRVSHQYWYLIGSMLWVARLAGTVAATWHRIWTMGCQTWLLNLSSKLRNNMGHGRPQWPVQILQQKDIIQWHIREATKLWKTKQSCLPFSLWKLLSIHCFGSTGLHKVNLCWHPSLQSNGHGFGRATLAFHSGPAIVGLPCSSPCINLASKPWLATLSAPITSALGAPWAFSFLQAGFGFGLCLGLGLCFSCRLGLGCRCLTLLVWAWALGIQLACWPCHVSGVGNFFVACWKPLAPWAPDSLALWHFV